MLDAIVLFVAIYALNVIPAFSPPTWMALSFIGFNHPSINVSLLSLLAALAATSGRLTLAKLSRVIIRRRFLSEASRQNIDTLKQALERRPAVTVGAFLFYAFSPLPSNYLFIAYGLTTLRLRLIVLPFFFGRFVSYNFWTFSASRAAQHLVLEGSEAESYFGIYFVVTQCLVLALVYAFTRIDWPVLLHERRLRWRSPAQNGSPRE